MPDLTETLDDLELSARTHGCLQNAGCRTVGDVIKLSERDCLSLPNFGRKSLVEIKEVLAYRGLHLATPFAPKICPKCGTLVV